VKPKAALPYQAPFWLPGSHLQTIIPALLPRRPLNYRRERLLTADGDFIDLDWTGTPPTADAVNNAPTVLLFHGLEGSSNSHYALALMRAVQALGWHGVVAHFRGCSGELNLAPRFYHSGDSAEIDFAIKAVRARSFGPMFAAGVSLGGNALLCWLAEQGAAAGDMIDAAAALCAPLDLAAGGQALARGFNLVYTQMFLRSLKTKSARKLEQYPGLFDRRRMLEARNLYEFDNIVTAPLHGFKNTDEYWSKASSKPRLGRVATPTLIINARNDPFQPATAWPLQSDLSQSITFMTPEQGGHVGFLSAGRKTEDWLSARVLQFFRRGQ
jgi:predicted alpha/beta-fold hydrolase